MSAIVLESGLGSQYEDAPDSYEFQSRYLRHFEPLSRGGSIFAVIYEPRGETGGRMAYVGSATIASPPVRTGRRNRAGEELWRVYYSRPAEPFDIVVPREVLGTTVEGWLNELPRGRMRNVATLGRAVRPLNDADLEKVLTMSSAIPLSGNTIYPVLNEHSEVLTAARERVDRIVGAYERRAAFRREVLDAYAYQCAVSGLGLGGVVPNKSRGFLDAAHIRPVRDEGVDTVANGIALTPTLHRLFDQGLFTFQYVDAELEVVASPRLAHSMVEVPGRGVSLSVRTGVRALVPTDVMLRPSPGQLEYHRKHVYISA